MDDLLQWFVCECEKIFQGNLHSILLLGSAQRLDMTPFSDIDIVIILKTMNLAQTIELRWIIRSSSRLFDCSILCCDEIPKNPDEFCIGSHGCYQLELVLKKAQCIWGDNILLTINSPTEYGIRTSIRRKITEYFWWTQRMVVESNRERTILMNYNLNSRLIKMIRDILYLEGEKWSITGSVENVLRVFLVRFRDVLSPDEKRAIEQLGECDWVNRNIGDMSDEYLLMRYSIAEKIHKRMTQIA